MQPKLVFLVVLFLNFTTHNFSQEGKLNRAKERLKIEKSTIKTSKSVKEGTTTRTNTAIANPFLKILYVAAAYTVYGVAFETPFERNGRMHDAEIANYPYKQASYGNFIYTNTTNYNTTRFDVYNHFLVDSKQLYGNDFGVNFRFLKRFAFNMNTVHFIEKVNNQTAYFSTYSALLKYYRIRTQRLDAWFGLGATHITTGVNKTGFTFGVGGEWFIKKPISLAASYKTTRVNKNSVNNAKVLLKYHLKNYRIATGYVYYNLANTKINAISIGVEASF